ncbi:MAG: iron-containing alcohol dehydrogenase [Clostridia bacterium]|nr:iron-containing alcohol dehydrogenase [Clostridia bacterium]
MYITDVVDLPRFLIGRGVYARFPSLCARYGSTFAVVGGVTAMEKGMPALRESLSQDGAPRLLAELPYSGACTFAAMERLAKALAPLHPDFLVGMGGGKAIDTAKGVADALGIPLVSMPTLVSNCAPITALSVVYREDGPFDQFRFYDAPPAMTIIDLCIAANAPAAYFRAGMGDTLAKHLESSFSARGDVLGEEMDHMSQIAIALSSTCYGPILQYGEQAMEEVRACTAGSAMEICARSIIISAGLVSLMANDQYNCALAHAVCYGLQLFPHVEEHRLHGDLVAYGALVQLMVDGQTEKAQELRQFLVSIGTDVTLRQIGVPLDRSALDDTLTEATTGPDMAHIPYPITKDMVYDAMAAVEAMSR